jgi:hypothetical protein
MKLLTFSNNMSLVMCLLGNTIRIRVMGRRSEKFSMTAEPCIVAGDCCGSTGESTLRRGRTVIYRALSNRDRPNSGGVQRTAPLGAGSNFRAWHK